jgi:ABC-type multidrug transport system fused ATPase/permease subunit
MQMKLRFAAQKHTDERVKLINEMLKGIRVVKCYAWEEFMQARTDVIRDKEIRLIRTRSILGAFLSLCMWSAPAFATVAVFVSFNLVGHPMDKTSLPQVFTALLLFNNLKIPLIVLPWMMTMYADAKVSMGRLEQLLMREELPEEARTYTTAPGVAIQVRASQRPASERGRPLASLAAPPPPPAARRRRRRHGGSAGTAQRPGPAAWPRS